jgi:hypothetical protein
MNTRYVAIALGIGALLMSHLEAHHGLATFDAGKNVTLEGTVTAFEWTNPHGYLYIDIADQQGVANWRIEFSSIGRMRLFGLTRTTFKAGDKVRVTGNPRRDGFREIFFRHLRMADGTEIGERPSGQGR